MLIEQELLDLKKKVDNARSEEERHAGQQTQILRQLKDDYDCDSVEEAEKKLNRLKKQVENLDEELEEGVKQLRKDMGINE
jgi:tetrahydromethanopterin S-methyltransferase subunit G